MRYIACEGILYRGTNLREPEEVWHYQEKAWVPYVQHALETSNPQWIDEAAAEALKSNNTAAEHFLYYDPPAPWSQAGGVRRAAPDGSGKKRYAIYERDGAIFRTPAHLAGMMVEEVRHPQGWVRYNGDRVKPVMFGEFIGFEEEDQTG